MLSVNIVTSTHEPVVRAAILSAGAWLPTGLPTTFLTGAGTSDIRLLLGVPDFDLYLAAPLLDLQANKDYSEVVITAFIEPGVSARVTLTNEAAATGSDHPLKILEASLNFDVDANRARPRFFSDSLYAVLVLAGSVQITIPEARLDIGVHFEAPISEISTLLERRQIYFALMVIEQATGMEFEIPEYMTGNEISAISFTYHAMLDREFTWVCNDVTMTLPATEESIATIKSLPATEPGSSTFKVMFGPTPKSQTIFGHEVFLGEETLYLNDVVIDNLPAILLELSQSDGHPVAVRFQPLSRIGRYLLPNAPNFSNSSWDESVLNCINLEGRLNERLAALLHELAASTLKDLTPEQVKDVTSRPALGEDAHMIK
jgi:hypothetical protein